MDCLYVADGTYATRCYRCGEVSTSAEKCIDDYPTDLRKGDERDCRDELGHTNGCTKSKYTDPSGRQIGAGCINDCVTELQFRVVKTCNWPIRANHMPLQVNIKLELEEWQEYSVFSSLWTTLQLAK